jgi:hypothetical protein
MPVRRLYLMMKKLNVKVFAFSCLFFSACCPRCFFALSTEYNLVTSRKKNIITARKAK